MKRYILTPSAKRDESAMIKLAKNPGVGHWREELADKRHRFFLVYSYLIVYRHEAKPLQIVRVLHAARDVQSILGLSPDEP
jgi:antitoxin ParD1/3/4/toxin ParE1/3/4